MYMLPPRQSIRHFDSSYHANSSSNCKDNIVTSPYYPSSSKNKKDILINHKEMFGESHPSKQLFQTMQQRTGSLTKDINEVLPTGTKQRRNSKQRRAVKDKGFNSKLMLTSSQPQHPIDALKYQQLNIHNLGLTSADSEILNEYGVNNSNLVNIQCSNDYTNMQSPVMKETNSKSNKRQGALIGTTGSKQNR